MKLEQKDVKLIAEVCVGKTEAEIAEILVSHFNIMLQELLEENRYQTELLHAFSSLRGPR